MRILVVEDQSDLREILVRKLCHEGYAVDSCSNGKEALDYLACAEYDGIVLDILLPELTGLGVLRKMRSSGNSTPVLLLTALGSVEDRVAGLDAGADDYLVKPFSFDELLARLRAIGRRRGTAATSIYEHRGVRLDLAARRVWRNGSEISLTAREFSILEYLMQNIGRVLSREKLSGHIWNYDYVGASNVIDVYVYHLRKKLDKESSEKFIETVKGYGYVIR